MHSSRPSTVISELDAGEIGGRQPEDDPDLANERRAVGGLAEGEDGSTDPGTGGGVCAPAMAATLSRAAVVDGRDRGMANHPHRPPAATGRSGPAVVSSPR